MAASTFKQSLLGTPGRIQALPNFSKEQQGLLGQLVGGLGGQGGALGGGLDVLKQLLGGGSGSFQDQAQRQFQEQTIPGLAERFSGMGAGAQQSSAFGQQLGQAGAGLAENLAAQRSQFQQAGLSQLQSLLGTSLTSPFSHQLIPGQQGGLQKLLGGFGQAAGAGIGQGIGAAGGQSIFNFLTGGGRGSNIQSGQMFSPGFGIQSGG